MNEQAANALYEAERRGVTQLKGAMFGNGGAMCAYGAIIAAQLGHTLSSEVSPCPLCGALTANVGMGKDSKMNERTLMAHLNDDHGLTFGEIARKLGPDHA